jgi:hypothetical protein
VTCPIFGQGSDFRTWRQGGKGAGLEFVTWDEVGAWVAGARPASGVHRRTHQGG